MSASQYITSGNLTSTTLTLVVSETPYYIKNVQSPIAKKPEVVFRTLLFSFLCLETCAIAFVICKLIIIPLLIKIHSTCARTDQIWIYPIDGTKAAGHH